MKLRRLKPNHGPILGYLECLPMKDRQSAERAIQQLLLQPEGAILLEVLENATLNRAISVVADPRALDALNAQSLIAHDLRRIVNDEDYIAVGPKAPLEHTRTRRR